MSTNTAAESVGNAEAPKKLRIFMSYGHDAFEALAGRLCEDLEKRGHDVWFDKKRLLPGNSWELKIEEGLEWVNEGSNSGWVILLMTPHSVRRPEGYCLNELERAIERRIPIVPIMVITVEPPLSICRLQYLDMTDCIPLSERTASYERKLEIIFSAIEKNTLAVEGEANRLRRALRPVSYEFNTIYYQPRFLGRRSIIGEFDKWLADPKGGQLFWLTGSLGTGKSALAAWLSEHRREIKAFHVCGYHDLPKADHREALRSIAWQLSTQIPDYRERLNAIGDIETICRDPESDLFDRLLVQPLHGLATPQEPVIILIDGLDEATFAGANALADLLSREMMRLPAWVRFALTSAPEEEVTVPLQAWKPLELVSTSEENKQDIVDYVEKYILPFSATGYISPALLERLFEAGEFNWLYIDWVRRALERKHLTLDTLYEFPQGLGGACHHEFSRRFPDISLYRRTHRPFLAVLAAACEPMGTAEYARILGCPEADIHDIIRDLGALLSSYENRVRPFHHILIEWLMDEKKSGQHSICLADGHRQIAADAWLQFERDPAAMSDYAKAHLPKHLLVSGDMEKLERCVTDARFVGFALAADTLYELARYWKSIPRQRLRSLCASSSSALLRRKEDAAVGHAAVLGMGQLFQQIGMYADAVVYFGKALFLARRWKDAYAIGQSELNTGWCLRHVDRFDQAIRHASMAMKCFREAGSCEGLARALSVRGICRWHLREDLAALGDLKEAASLYEGCGDSRGRAEALNHLGIVHRSLGMYKEALQCLRDSEALSTRYKDAKSLGKCLNSLGTAYWWMGDREEAIEFYAQANRINEEVNQPYVLGLTANNLGYVLLEKRRYQAAYESFKHARDIRQNLDISSYEMMDVSGLALASHYLQRPDEAKMLTKLAIKKLGHAIAVEDIERLYYNHYLIMKDGNRQEEIESARALRNALNLVKARMRKLADKKVLSRFRDSVPLVRAILKAADET